MRIYRCGKQRQVHAVIKQQLRDHDEEQVRPPYKPQECSYCFHRFVSRLINAVDQLIS